MASNKILDAHALNDGDQYIVLSMRNGSENAALHFCGDPDKLTEMLGMAVKAIMNTADITVN